MANRYHDGDDSMLHYIFCITVKLYLIHEK